MNSVVDWQSHETYPTGHNISEVDWGALHNSSFFLFLVNIDYDAKPKDFITQELWGGDTIPTKNGRELMEKWVSELKDKFLGPNWQRMLSCAYTTQLLHSTGEVCWNNKDSYFIWFEFVC